VWVSVQGLHRRIVHIEVGILRGGRSVCSSQYVLLEANDTGVCTLGHSHSNRTTNSIDSHNLHRHQLVHIGLPLGVDRNGEGSERRGSV
jgi:hypothetical protein